MHKYPHTLLLLTSFALAYICYLLGWFEWVAGVVDGYGYFSIFFGGLLFSCGFTAAFAVGLFVAMADSVHPVAAAVVAGTGSFLTDFLLFHLVRSSVMDDELNRLRTTQFFLRIKALFNHPRLTERFRMYLLWSFAGIIIASPFPDELGVVLISGATQMNKKTFALLCFSLNTAGIFMVLLGARAAGL